MTTTFPGSAIGGGPARSTSPSGPYPVTNARSISAASPEGDVSPPKKSRWPSTKASPTRPSRSLAAASAPTRTVQSPPATSGFSPLAKTTATVERISEEDLRICSKPITPVRASRLGSSTVASTSPASRAPVLSASPASLSALGARASPLPVPEQSSGAPTKTHLVAAPSLVCPATVTSQCSLSADIAAERKILPLEALSYYELRFANRAKATRQQF